ncbi:ran GDP/GTP exchange factor [Schizosaccharomyces cryophilus OY26]|uniref:Ran GDP/GTP exchange factor n=1 Tax=Schizosaccharomyces cryophilus (strain OY26 / ATCC MYA-4695 / CBS 11777 / NBRC 106824 / NRRL Y48691) TaxID=653667 RepID=S9X3H9_SCHCR|nr:ran GDP/GTP exchange factor [Schizosaccharomyces cryophilus OY26]EPY51662.1 ran GDP/GTP exchange factor [Schizosaccharomyces cryophilus OY26]
MSQTRVTRRSQRQQEALGTSLNKRELEDHEAPVPTKPSKKRVKVSSGPKPKRTTGRKLNSIPALPNELLNVFVFGTGSMNELGMGDLDVDVAYRPRLNPNLPRDKIGVVDLAVGGMHSAVLSHDGRVFTWGVNDDFALGRPTKNQTDKEGNAIDNDLLEGTPSQVTGAIQRLKVTKVCCSDNLTSVITENGSCFSWGTFRCSDGILGFSESSKRASEPVQMPLPEVAQLAAGTDHILALTTTGKVYTWGNGQQCQLGRRMMDRRRLQGLNPEPLALKNIVAVGAGSYHSFAINNKGKVYAWGLNMTKQCAIADEEDEEEGIVTKPTLVEALEPYKIKAITGGEHHSLALLEDGRVLAWGRQDRHQLGIPDDALPESLTKDEKGYNYSISTPTIIPGLSNVVQVCCGTHHSLAVTNDGKVYSWGSSENYEVGQGDTDEEIVVPTLVRSKAITNASIRVAGAGGQFSVIAGAPNEPETKPAENGVKTDNEVKSESENNSTPPQQEENEEKKPVTSESTEMHIDQQPPTTEDQTTTQSTEEKKEPAEEADSTSS